MKVRMTLEVEVDEGTDRKTMEDEIGRLLLDHDGVFGVLTCLRCEECGAEHDVCDCGHTEE